MSLFSSLFLVGILLILSGFFSASETAVFSLNRIERRRISEKHPFIGKIVNDLLDRPRRTLITILIGNMTVNTLASVIVTLIAVQWFGNVGVGLAIAVFTIALLLFGEIVPKVFAIRNNMLITETNAIFLTGFAKLFFPIRFLVRRFSDWVLSFLVKGVRDKADLMSENELKALVRIGEEEGVLRKEEGRMITRLIDLGIRQTKEIMTPKTEFVAFNLEEGREALLQLVKTSHFTYIPVYEGSIDNLLGVISTQEFMLVPETSIRNLVQVADYIPETKPIDELLVEFKLKGKKFAICVDEYGSVSGLVTFEDVLEEIFGEFHDEYAKVDPLIKEISRGEFLVQARVTLRELNHAIGSRLESESSETLNGWILERLGHIPSHNENFSVGGFQFQIAEVFKNRIHKVHIRKES
ncbi:MAG: HlyC/CorC family transporter [Candidatus Omnitrophica bacterium]|nr:HlyC/CorC family transporter [Candidatus Omnitrophota bacterium]